MISTLFFNSSLLSISFVMVLMPCRTVVWSFLPIAFAIFCRELDVSSLQKYMTTCLGCTNSAVLFLEAISSGLTPKCSATTSIIKEGRITMDSTLFYLEKAKILFNAPSNSLILDFTFSAI